MESKKIALKTGKGIEFLRKEDIAYCVAHGRYTKIITVTGEEYMLTRVLKDIELNLSGEFFFRTHKSFLINLNHIDHYNHNHDHPIVMVNNFKIQLAKRRKNEFHERLKEFATTI